MSLEIILYSFRMLRYSNNTPDDVIPFFNAFISVRLFMKKEPKKISAFTLIGTFFPVLLTVLFTACTQSNSGYKAIEIDFLNVRTLEEGDWIEIDGVRFNHVKAYEEVEANVLTLPASRITRGPQRSREDYTEPFPSLNIGYLLASYLHNINKEAKLMVEHDHTYTIINPDLMMAMGKLQFIRADTSEFKIKTSPDYPVPIRAYFTGLDGK